MESKFLQDRSAKKVIIKELLEGELVQEEGFIFLKVNHQNIYRLNLIAVIVKKEKRGSILNILLDDGSGKILIRFFEENETANKIMVGEVIIFIGKIRSYQGERYLSPEIVRKVDPLWLKIRSLEKASVIKKNEEQEEQIEEKKENIIQEKIIEDKIETIMKPPFFHTFEKISQLIKVLDEGEGVFIEEIIEKSSLPDTEKILNEMLEKGEIFQNLPGKVKVL